MLKPFEAIRPNLLGLAYRILGSMADAEDAVQDTYLKWEHVDFESVNNPQAWLTTACTRRCLDIIKSSNRNRVSYVGTWLPEPIHTPIEIDIDHKLELAQSLTTAFLLMLERLTPKERAAYLLYEIFDAPYAELAKILELKESACRQLVSRAKKHINRDKIRHVTPLKKQDAFLVEFKLAITSGDTTNLEILLSDDVRLSADGGGKVAAIGEILCGKPTVVGFLQKNLSQYWQGQGWKMVDINNVRGAIIQNNGVITATVSFAYNEKNKVTDIFIVRNPDKISFIGKAIIH